MRKRHRQVGQRFVESSTVLAVELPVIVDTDGSHFHEVLQEFLVGLLVQVPHYEGVRLDVGNQLLLFLQDVLKVV